MNQLPDRPTQELRCLTRRIKIPTGGTLHPFNEFVVVVGVQRKFIVQHGDPQLVGGVGQRPEVKPGQWLGPHMDLGAQGFWLYDLVEVWRAVPMQEAQS